MNCERCNRRLSRKTARQIDGVVLCAPCMFGPSPLERAKASYRPMRSLDEMVGLDRESRRDSDAMLGTKPAGLSPEGGAARACSEAEGIAQKDQQHD